MGGGWTSDPNRARYGCFLPDLTGLASDLPTANLPPPISGIWAVVARVGKTGRLFHFRLDLLREFFRRLLDNAARHVCVDGWLAAIVLYNLSLLSREVGAKRFVGLCNSSVDVGQYLRSG